MLEYHWYWISQCIKWIVLENYLLINSPIGWYINQASNSHSVKCPYITSMHHLDPSFILCWWLFILVYIWWTAKVFVNTFENRCHVKFLGILHWFISNRISQLKYHSISVDHDRYVTSVVEKISRHCHNKIKFKFP